MQVILENKDEVLIVPLWNWNYFKTLDWYVYYGFNRTFMELKYE